MTTAPSRRAPSSPPATGSGWCHDTPAVLTGWGRATQSRCTLRASGRSADDRVLDDVGPRGATPRGLGRGYGDAALNTGGVVLDRARADGALHVDAGTGLLSADAGVSLAGVLRACVPLGWLPPVLPGTAQVSLGGALAADVHGKNHLRTGSFSAHVVDAVLLTPAHGRITIGPDVNAELFWATAGGLGLTGVLLTLRVQLVRAPHTTMVETTTRAADLDSVLQLLHSGALEHEHAVAWLDGHASGPRLGRGIVSVADRAEQLDRHHPGRGRAYSVPHWSGPNLVTTAAIRTANAVRVAAHPGTPTLRRTTLASVLHPLDRVRGWNHLYGTRGLVQHQLAVPHGAEAVLGRALQLVQRAGCPPTLVVLKALGPASPGPLGFPSAGWTLAMDIPAGAAGVARSLLELDRMVVSAGGRVYLVKDGLMRPELVAAMYPRLEQWRATCRSVDPDGVMTSDLDRRLQLRGTRSVP